MFLQDAYKPAFAKPASMRPPTNFSPECPARLCFEPGMSEAPPLVLRRTFALCAAVFPRLFPISTITNGTYIAYHITDSIYVIKLKSKWFPHRSRFRLAQLKLGRVHINVRASTISVRRRKARKAVSIVSNL